MNLYKWLDKNNIETVCQKYKSVYEDYINTVSTEIMATSFEQCIILYLISCNLYDKKILDAGSGISSYFLRVGSINTSSVNYTIDTSIEWLLKTKNFLEFNKINSNHMYSLLESNSDMKYDFIYYDLGYIHERIGFIHNITSRLNVGGMIMIDDLHFNSSPDCMVHDFVYQYYTSDLWTEIDIRSISTDKYGRYATIFVKK